MNFRHKSKKWSHEERAIVLALLEESKFHREISKELKKMGYNRSTEAVRKFIKRYENSCDTFSANPIIESELLEESENMEFIDALEKIEQQRQNMFKLASERHEKLRVPKGKLRKVVSISDFHIPWVNDNVIADMMSKHSDAEVLVINGDFLDQYSVSKWPKSKGILLRHEYETGIEYLKYFSNVFKKVILTRGNHDSRLESYFSTNLDPSVCFLTSPDPLERMTNGYSFDKYNNFKKMFDFNNVYYSGGVSAWYTKVGKCIFAHPSGGSKIPMRLAVNTAEYFLEREDFDAVVVGHTHKLGSIVYKGKLLIEQGCCCVPMDYEADAKMRYSQQAFGYAVIYMNAEGKVHFNKSKPVYFGTATVETPDAEDLLGD